MQRALLCSALIYALAVAPAARAESVPASVRACTLETDSLKRLICFDREVARYSDQPSTGDAKQVPVGPSARDLRSQPTTAGANLIAYEPCSNISRTLQL